MAEEAFFGANFVPENDLDSASKEFEKMINSSPLSNVHTVTSVLDQQLSPAVESSLCTTSAFPSPPLCRQFWKAGNYECPPSSKSTLPSKCSTQGTSYLHIHPKFLHSNATSHKWPFGAIAELIDNAIDEVQNGATFVIIDKTFNPKDGTPAFLIQDDGGGMDPEAMRHCLSFGFSDKKSKEAIGQYGNGFKTSSMRLGSDVIVFSRCIKNRKLTQSIGLLSFTFLTQTGHDRIVVPMVDYEFNDQINTWTSLNSAQHDLSNLSLLLKWSPCASKDELLEQLDDIGKHGTKIVIYNLWHTNDDIIELDFESDPEDIRIAGEESRSGKSASRLATTEQHLANQLRVSLRAYLSILYLRVPENFWILLRGRLIEYHNIASDLQFPECILYRPHSGAGSREAKVITTIGFLKDAPVVNIHGLNVYHKNRLILPFWRVVSYSRSRGRGVVGVLEANFIQPIHNKQDFEKTPAFQKLEQRLKEMTLEYWDFHCGLIGYQVYKKPRLTSQAPPDSPKGPLRRDVDDGSLGTEVMQKRTQVEENAMVSNNDILPASYATHQSNGQIASDLIEENKRFRAKCSEHERKVEELNLKVAGLRLELAEVQDVYARLLAESMLLEEAKKASLV